MVLQGEGMAHALEGSVLRSLVLRVSCVTSSVKICVTVLNSHFYTLPRVCLTGKGHSLPGLAHGSHFQEQLGHPQPIHQGAEC